MSLAPGSTSQAFLLATTASEASRHASKSWPSSPGAVGSDQPSFLRSMGRLSLLSFSLVCACLSLSCATPQVSLLEGPREYVPTDYDEVLSRWTRTGSVLAISEIDSRLTVTATYESWDFRWAYVSRYAADYRLTVQERQSLLDSTLADSRTHHQFYIALYGEHRRELDLSRKKSAYVVRLVDSNGDETSPDDISWIRAPGVLERTYFPYTSPWRLAFRLRFPTEVNGHPTIAPDAQWFGLRFAGAEGNQDITWEIQPGKGPAQAL